jgi:hypothetical protein
VSEKDTSWFHCGRCGSLFQSEPGAREDRLCPKCGFDPCPAATEAAPETTAPTTSAAPKRKKKPATPGTSGSRGPRKNANRHLTLKLIAGWSLVLALIVFGAAYMWHFGDQQKATATPTAKAAVSTKAVPEEDTILLEEAGQKCNQAFSGYLSSGTPEARNQFVLNPIATASRMARFYTLNPSTNIDPQTLSLTAHGVLHLPGSRAIETQWKSQDGQQVDAIFREENGEWRLDWDHYARYSDYPWALFIAGSGPAEGEFRLLARERLAKERQNEESISVVFYAPRFGQPRETGFQSPEFLVSRKIRDGQLLDAAFKLARSGGQVFDSRLPDLNPDGMIRVRVKVRRIEAGGMERRFEITGITACHWYSVEDPGVQPEPPAAEKPAEK